MFGLGHMDITPLVYGVIMFLGIRSLWKKLARGQFTAFLIEGGIFWLVFQLHGGTMAGGFSAMICALLAGFFLPRRLK